jgi:Protein of unknown function (DUF1353)
MGYFAPAFENPYPSPDWEEISDFEYLTPLRLCWDPRAGAKRDGEDTDYVVSDDYRVRYQLDGEAREITVPAGMLTDLVSVPWSARWLVDRVGPYLEAAIVHDFLYIAWQDVAGRGARPEDRRFADELMRVAMETAGVGATLRFVIHSAVRIFGRRAYKEFDARRYWRADLPALAVVTDRAA